MYFLQAEAMTQETFRAVSTTRINKPLIAVCKGSYVMYACGFDWVGKWLGIHRKWESI